MSLHASPIEWSLFVYGARMNGTHPVLGLFVHKDNKRAIKFYKDAGFSDELEQRVDKSGHLKMFIVLDAEALEAAIAAAKD